MARRPNRRVRRIWLSVAATVGGLALLTALGVWIDRARNTDLQDPTANVTAELMHQEIPDDAPDLRFTDVALELGVDTVHGPGPRGRTLPEDTGSGLAWADYDGDGDDDLYVVSFPGPLDGDAKTEDEGGNRLFRNDGDRFVDVTDVAGVRDAGGFGMGASFADSDGDGDLDLFVANYGPNRYFENTGDGTYADRTDDRGLADDRWAIAAVWGDADRDGRLDLYVTNYVEFDAEIAYADQGSSDPNWEAVPFTLNPNAFDPQSNLFYRQDEDGQFVESALERGISNPEGRSLSVTFADFDADGWLDLYVANDVSPNALFRNLGGQIGDALFEDIGPPTGTADPRGSMGVSVADLPVGDDPGPDGLPDLFITHWVAQENALYQGVRIGERLEYRDRIRQLRIAEISTDRVGWGSAFVDLDLDGRLDLYVANGSTLEEDASSLQAQLPFVLWNAGDRFVDLTATAGADVAQPRVARGLAVSDHDRDGDADLAVSINRGRPLVLRNEIDPGDSGWLGVSIAASPALLHGARIARLGPGGVTDARWHGADVSYASMHSAEHLFGLGAVETVDGLEITLVDGSTTRWTDLPGGRRYRLRPSPRSAP